MKRVYLVQFQINDLLIFHRTGRGSRFSRYGSRCIILDGRSAANTATTRGRLVRGIFAPLALGHFVPGLFLLGWLVLWLFCSFWGAATAFWRGCCFKQPRLRVLRGFVRGVSLFDLFPCCPIALGNQFTDFFNRDNDLSPILVRHIRFGFILRGFFLWWLGRICDRAALRFLRGIGFSLCRRIWIGFSRIRGFSGTRLLRCRCLFFVCHRYLLLKNKFWSVAQN